MKLKSSLVRILKTKTIVQRIPPLLYCIILVMVAIVFLDDGKLHEKKLDKSAF